MTIPGQNRDKYGRMMFEYMRTERDILAKEVDRLHDALAWERDSHARTRRILKDCLPPQVNISGLGTTPAQPGDPIGPGTSDGRGDFLEK